MLIRSDPNPKPTRGASSARSAPSGAPAPRSGRAHGRATRCGSRAPGRGCDCARSSGAGSSASAWCPRSRWASSPGAGPPS